MNCKPGDVCIVLGAPDDVPLAHEHTDKLIRVTKSQIWCGEIFWEYEGKRLFLEDGREVEAFMDKYLRPIRDPGKDARDETLEWLQVPSEKEPA
jgi:hypothetical protein